MLNSYNINLPARLQLYSIKKIVVYFVLFASWLCDHTWTIMMNEVVQLL